VKSGKGVKEMAEMLRQGAKMLSYSCPECGSPLFQLKSGEVWCARCQKRVVIVAEDEDESTGGRSGEGEGTRRGRLRPPRLLGEAQTPHEGLTSEQDDGDITVLVTCRDLLADGAWW